MFYSPVIDKEQKNEVGSLDDANGAQTGYIRLVNSDEELCNNSCVLGTPPPFRGPVITAVADQHQPAAVAMIARERGTPVADNDGDLIPWSLVHASERHESLSMVEVYVADDAEVSDLHAEYEEIMRGLEFREDRTPPDDFGFNVYDD